jgi:exonuclease SbcC
VNVSTISLAGFMSHAKTVVKLPRTGVVLVVGENGSGKSSIIEAVSVAGWGVTLRGSEPWQESAAKSWAGFKTLEDLDVIRTRTKSTKKLVWSAGGEATTYETTGKAQDALEHVIGSWDVWRRTCVFSSHDAAHFSLATDGERKRLLEQVLGLDRFDIGSEKCRAELRLAEQEVARHKLALATSIARRDNEAVRIQDAARLLDAEPEIPDATVEAATANRLEGLVRAADTDIRAAEIEMRKADAAGGEEAALARQITATLARLRADTCPTCTQPIPTDMRLKLTRDADAAGEKSRQAHERALVEAAGTLTMLGELREERDLIAKKAIEARSKVQQVEQAMRRVKQLTAQKQAAHDAHEAASQSANDSIAILNDAETNLALLQACDKVLSLRGVRATVLGEALSGIEAVANDWLGRLASKDMRLKLNPYATRKSGATSEVIAMEVTGAGGGFGYKASSGGERRRIDIALMLALAEVAAAAYGLPPGTLFFDECLDALDESGVDCAVDAIEELGRNRCVLVISHSKALVSALRPSKVIRVEGGIAR